eukprot:Filipodium_phascolosomae@DN1456_c0_g1_i1.p1
MFACARLSLRVVSSQDYYRNVDTKPVRSLIGRLRYLGNFQDITSIQRLEDFVLLPILPVSREFAEEIIDLILSLENHLDVRRGGRRSKGTNLVIHTDASQLAWGLRAAIDGVKLIQFGRKWTPGESQASAILREARGLQRGLQMIKPHVPVSIEILQFIQTASV